ncbi:GAF domain-containing protein [Actinocorallia longicatena]|uniref:GAF domain-containing protein n=1 Tax=Actinocorallia longicatena TaxID=111803 RepID=A0ABP6QCM9_9ACTN
MTETEAFAINWPLNGTYRGEGAINGSAVDRITASFDLMAALVKGIDLNDALTRVAEGAREIAAARLVFIALPGTAVNTLTVGLAVGADADRVLGMTVRSSSSVLGRVFSSRRAIASRVAGSTSRTTGGFADTGLPPGPILLLPLDTGEATRGVLAVAGHQADLPYSASLRRQLSLFASMSANLIELAEERRAARR